MDTKPINKELVADAYEVLSGIPEEFIYLNRFVWSGGFDEAAQKPECGTIACGIGWLAMHPSWRAKGLQLEKDDDGDVIAYTERGVACAVRYDFDEAVDALFGRGSYETMFTMRGYGTYDDEILAVYPDLSDKELLLARMKKVYYGEE